MTPDAIKGIWDAIQSYDFHATHGAFGHMDIYGHGQGDDVRRRVLQSMKIVVKGMGWTEHDILGLEV